MKVQVLSPAPVNCKGSGNGAFLPKGTALLAGRRPKGVAMSFLYTLIALLIAAAIISVVLSFLGVIFVGALKLIPIVLIILVVLVLMGKIKISVVRGDDDDDRRWLN